MKSNILQDIQVKIDNQMKRLEEVAYSCELYLQSKPEKVDTCNEKCPLCQFCWELQDEEPKVAEAMIALQNDNGNHKGDINEKNGL